MNPAFFQFLTTQILPPSAAALCIALALAVLAALWPRSGLWRPAAEIALLGLSFWPGVGLIAGAAYDLWRRDRSLLLVAGVVTFLALPLALWGVPFCSVPCPCPTGWAG